MCKRWVLCATLLALATSAAAGELEPNLERIINEAADGSTFSTLVFLTEQVDLEALERAFDIDRATLEERHEITVRMLQERAAATQAPVRAALKQLQAAGQVTKFESYWVANTFLVEGTEEAVRTLAARADVAMVYLNYPFEMVGVVGTGPETPGGIDAPESGLVAIRVPEVWQLGFDGTGVLTAIIDTGVQQSHVALKDRWRGLDPNYAGHVNWAWKDSLGGQPNPVDTYGHGTHVMGTVLGGAPGDQVGCAPGAEWIASNTINQGTGSGFNADIIADFQWLIDPDGNPATFWDVPTAVSNSWGLTTGLGMPPCDPLYWQYLDAAETAGIVVIFSAGNEGPSANTHRRPADRSTDDYRTMSVGAVDGRTAPYPIAGFSSRGPTYCNPPQQAFVKPNISAPGVQVRSCLRSGGYGNMDGTSMASPHVNGVVVLMRQACPNLTVTQCKQIIYETATDKGAAGKDNDYGWGLIDAYRAVLAAQAACGPQPPKAFDGAFDVPRNGTANVTLAAWDDGTPNPPGKLTYIITALPTNGKISDPGAGPITAVPYTLVNYGTVVVYKPKAYYTGSDTLRFKVDDGGTPPQGGESNVATVTGTIKPPAAYSVDLSTNPNWTISGGQWAFGKPSGGGTGAKDPSNGFTGTNVYGYNLAGDYPNNMPEYHLTSTAFDCSQLTNVKLRYRRWLGVEENIYDHAYIRVSNNGTTWTTAWQNPASNLDDGAWMLHEVDISSVANNKATVYLRWTMGTSDVGLTFCGWNIDDIEIVGDLPYVIRVGDLNCDGNVDFYDINPFVQVLSDPNGWQQQYPTCPMLNGDCNGDGKVDFFDINEFVALLSS